MSGIDRVSYVPAPYLQYGDYLLQHLRTIHPDYVFEAPTKLENPQHLEAMVANILTYFSVYYIREIIICRSDPTSLFKQVKCNVDERSPYDFLIFVKNLNGELTPAIIEVDGMHHFRPKKDVRTNFKDIYETYGSYTFFMPDNANNKYYQPSDQDTSNFKQLAQNADTNFINSWLAEIKRLNNQIRNDRRKSLIPLDLKIPFLRLSSMDVGANYSLVPKILGIFIDYLKYSNFSPPLVVYSSIEQYLHLVPNDPEYLRVFTTIKEMQKKVEHWKQFGLPMDISENHYPNTNKMDIELNWLIRYPTTNTQVTEARLFNEITVGNTVISIPKI